jgi:AraC family transcriptional regulator
MRAMAVTSDTFADFVDVLAGALDDHTATGADLARRVHVSRFHLDRLVAAAAGEAPGALRRRVLLERAAYRLLTTDLTILEVGLDAGFSSQEAFTRAFSRAYGAAPGHWRRRPTSIPIDAPSGVHFHPPGGLRFPPRDKETSVDLIQRMVDHHVWLVGEMLDRSARLSDAQLDEPIELSVQGVDESPTLRSLLSRLVGQMDMWVSSIQHREYDFAVERSESVCHMRRRFGIVGVAFAAQVKEVCQSERLDETFVDTTCEPPRVFSYGGMIAHVLTFAAHRRTLVSGALYDVGIDDLHWDPISWVADPA